MRTSRARAGTFPLPAGRQLIHLAFGIVLGASVGFADGVVGLYAWLLLDRPDFFIRRDWGELTHIILLTFFGACAGLAYGFFLNHIARYHGGKLPLSSIFTVSLAATIPLLFIVHYVFIRYRLPWFIVPEIIVFALSHVVARSLTNRKGRLSGELQM